MALYEASRCFPQAIFARSGVDASEKGLRQLRNIVDHMSVPAPFANIIIVDTDRDDLDTTRFEYRDYVFAELGIVCYSVRHNQETAPRVSDVITETSDRSHSFASRGSIERQISVTPNFSATHDLTLV